MAAAATAALLRSSSGRVLCSSVVCKPVTGSCVLRIDGYSHLTQLLANRDRVESPAFDVGGLSWCLRLFPNGDTTRSKSHIAVYLRLVNNLSGERVSARAKFSVLDRHGNPAGFVRARRTVSRKNLKQGQSWGYSKWISKEELERSEYLVDDCFSVQCDAAVTTVRNCRDHLVFSSGTGSRDSGART